MMSVCDSIRQALLAVNPKVPFLFHDCGSMKGHRVCLRRLLCSGAENSRSDGGAGLWSASVNPRCLCLRSLVQLALCRLCLSCCLGREAMQFGSARYEFERNLGNRWGFLQAN